MDRTKPVAVYNCDPEDVMPDPLTPSEEVELTNLLIGLKGPVELSCDYTNWRGETANRRIRIKGFWYGSTDWHPEDSLMLKAYDFDKKAERDFRVADFDTKTLKQLQ